MDKLSTTLRARVVSTFVRTYTKRDQTQGSELRLSVLPEGRDWPVTISGPADLPVVADSWYDFDCLVRASAYADRDGGKPIGTLSVWARSAQLLVPASA